MSDKVIRISSQQGFSDEWLNAGAPTKLNLLDFVIPRGMVVDLSKSYVAFNTSMSHAAAGNFDGTEPVNAMLKMNGLDAANTAYEVPNTALIRNASIQSDKHGQIESLRRVETLKCALWNLEHDAEERKDDMNAFTAPKGQLGTGNQASYFLEPAHQTLDADDAVIPGVDSRQLSRDVKVPLKDVFGICSADDWSTDKHGETRMHFETNWKDVKSQALGGQEDVSVAPAGNTWGACNDVNNIAIGAAATALALTEPYRNPEMNCPFFVGQRILVKGNAPAAGTAIPAGGRSVVITSMDFARDQGIVAIATTPAWYTNDTAPAAIAAVDQITIEADNTYAANLQLAVNRAELVLFTKNDGGATSDEYNFVSYSLDQDNGNTITDFSRGYVVEPTAVNFFACLCPNGTKLPMTQIASYRYAIDNVEQTGNRSVEPDSPLHYDRLTRCLDVASPTTEWRNAQLKFYNIQPNANLNPTQPTAYDQDNTTICETMTQTAGPKYLDLQIVTAGGGGVNDLGDILIYKQHLRSL